MKKELKLSLIFLALAVVSTILHNLISMIIGKEEAIFFSAIFIFSLCFIVYLIYYYLTK